MTQNVAIIGSGFLGMTLALRLAQAGENVTLFESADKIGGLASSWQIGEFVWDKHYHVTLASDNNVRSIVNELGIGDEYNWVKTKTGFFTDGKLISMSDTREFLKFPPLGIINKLRLGGTIFWASKVTNWKRLETISVEAWLTRLSGKKTFNKIWKPLLKAKLGEAYQETSAAFIWATIRRMYAARNSGLKEERFGYVRGGYARVLERFAEILVESGVEIRLNSAIESIEKLDSGMFVITPAAKRRRGDPKPAVIPQKTKYGVLRAAHAVAQGFSGAFLAEPDLSSFRASRPSAGSTEAFDKVIVTCPSSTAANLAPQLSDQEKRALKGIRYQGIVCASVLLKRSISDFYVTNIIDESPFTGIIEMTSLVDKKEFGGNALLYLPKYVSPDDELFDKSDDEIKQEFLCGLEKMYPNFVRKNVLAFRVSRVRQVFPLPILHYSRDLPPVETSVAGMYIVNSSHIVNGTLNVNETVGLAEAFFKEYMTISEV